MDIYDFFNSSVVAKHCKKSKKVGFNTIHATVIVGLSCKHTDDEKRKAFQWIIENMRNTSMPDEKRNIPCIALLSDKYTEEERHTRTRVYKGWRIHDYIREVLLQYGGFPPENRVSLSDYNNTIPHPFEPCDFIRDIFTAKVYMIRGGYEGYEVYKNGNVSSGRTILPVLDCVYYTGNERYAYVPNTTFIR